jgi:rfaE bifunctional protein kinase chain/domain
MNTQRLEEIITRFTEVRIAVIGDFFLDRYWQVDADRDELSVETGLAAYQIVDRWQSPGAAGTVTNNLAALGVGKIYAVGFVGDDGEGFELQRELKHRGIDCEYLFATSSRFTPCYTKPLREGEESNRFDIKNRTPTRPEIEQRIIESIRELAPQVDAIMIMDQVSEENCGVVTENVREELISLGHRNNKPVIYADSRERIGQFREMIVKCNDREVTETFDSYEGFSPTFETLHTCGINLSKQTGRTVFITMGVRGQLIVDAGSGKEPEHIPAFLVEGEIDICGAGDATSSGLVAALCAGANYQEAATIGNLVSSITVRKIGQTGTATPKEIFAAWNVAVINSNEN